MTSSYLLTTTLNRGTLKGQVTSTSHVDCMNQVIHTKLGEGRRVAIPADICHEYHLMPGDPVVLEATPSGIVIRPLDAVVREVQAFFASVGPTDGLLSDELIRDRRAEAAREDDD
jgi:bifunctional DNA-binding transcriptional regulator/antitoxin component of YhaV-PrlF toxin-antitoxin module